MMLLFSNIHGVLAALGPGLRPCLTLKYADYQEVTSLPPM